MYFIYGMHHCANVVTGPEGDGQAVLIRALEPIGDLAPLRVARPKARRDIDLTNGPGKLCQALGIDRSHDGLDLLAGAAEVCLEFGDPKQATQVVQATRIGISKAKETKWRWYLRGNPNVSKP